MTKPQLEFYLPTSYEVDWNEENELSPIRFKPKSTEVDDVEKNIKIWKAAITKVTKSNAVPTDLYYRISTNHEDSDIHINIYYSTATVMIQGNKQSEWAAANIPNICNLINGEQQNAELAVKTDLTTPLDHPPQEKVYPVTVLKKSSIPRRSKDIMYLIRGETELKRAFTLQSQPKRKAKSGSKIYVNIKPENDVDTSIYWDDIEYWRYCTETENTPIDYQSREKSSSMITMQTNPPETKAETDIEKNRSVKVANNSKEINRNNKPGDEETCGEKPLSLEIKEALEDLERLGPWKDDHHPEYMTSFQTRTEQTTKILNDSQIWNEHCSFRSVVPEDSSDESIVQDSNEDFNNSVLEILLTPVRLSHQVAKALNHIPNKRTSMINPPKLQLERHDISGNHAHTSEFRLRSMSEPVLTKLPSKLRNQSISPHTVASPDTVNFEEPISSKEYQNDEKVKTEGKVGKASKIHTKHPMQEISCKPGSRNKGKGKADKNPVNISISRKKNSTRATTDTTKRLAQSKKTKATRRLDEILELKRSLKSKNKQINALKALLNCYHDIEINQISLSTRSKSDLKNINIPQSSREPPDEIYYTPTAGSPHDSMFSKFFTLERTALDTTAQSCMVDNTIITNLPVETLKQVTAHAGDTIPTVTRGAIITSITNTPQKEEPNTDSFYQSPVTKHGVSPTDVQFLATVLNIPNETANTAVTDQTSSATVEAKIIAEPETHKDEDVKVEAIVVNIPKESIGTTKATSAVASCETSTETVNLSTPSTTDAEIQRSAQAGDNSDVIKSHISSSSTADSQTEPAASCEICTRTVNLTTPSTPDETLSKPVSTTGESSDEIKLKVQISSPSKADSKSEPEVSCEINTGTKSTPDAALPKPGLTREDNSDEIRAYISSTRTADSNLEPVVSCEISTGAPSTPDAPISEPVSTREDNSEGIKAQISPDSKSKSVKDPHQVPQPCWHYLNSSCRFGKGCRHYHPPMTERYKSDQATEEKATSDTSNQTYQEYSKYAKKLFNELSGNSSKTYRSSESSENLQTTSRDIAHGLPNIQNNMCFIISVIHMLALTMIVYMQKTSTYERIDDIIKDTQQLLTKKTGNKDARMIAQNLWEYCKEKWPEYERDVQTSNQADAIEFLGRITTESPNIEHIAKTYIAIKQECTNQHCPGSTCHEINTEQQCINTTRVLPCRSEIELQEVIDNYLYPDDTKQCLFCSHEEKEIRTIARTNNLLFLQIPRIKLDGTKDNIRIRCRKGSVIIRGENFNRTYHVVGVITHLGNGVENGHYVYSHYNPSTAEWIILDDDKIHHGNQRKINEQGTLFILEKACKPDHSSYHTDEIEIREDSETRNRDNHINFLRLKKISKESSQNNHQSSVNSHNTSEEQNIHVRITTDERQREETYADKHLNPLGQSQINKDTSEITDVCTDISQPIYNLQYPLTDTDGHPNCKISRNEEDTSDTKDTSCPPNTEKTLRRHTMSNIPETELVISGEPAKDPSEVQQEQSAEALNQSDKHPDIKQAVTAKEQIPLTSDTEVLIGHSISKTWRNRSLLGESSTDATQHVKTSTKNLNICWYFVNYKRGCRYGKRCWNYHPPTVKVTAPAEQQNITSKNVNFMREEVGDNRFEEIDNSSHKTTYYNSHHKEQNTNWRETYHKIITQEKPSITSTLPKLTQRNLSSNEWPFLAGAQ